MSAKVINPFKLWDSASLGASIQTAGLDVTRLIYASIAIEWTGTPTGTIQLQGKNGDSGWLDITGKTVALSGVAGGFMMELTLLPWEQMRLSYARTSGTGTITATVIAKGW